MSNKNYAFLLLSSIYTDRFRMYLSTWHAHAHRNIFQTFFKDICCYILPTLKSVYNLHTVYFMHGLSIYEIKMILYICHRV